MRTAHRCLPRLQDASQLRDVPDHQEVWVDTASEASLVVECVDYVPHVQVSAIDQLVRACFSTEK